MEEYRKELEFNKEEYKSKKDSFKFVKNLLEENEVNFNVIYVVHNTVLSYLEHEEDNIKELEGNIRYIKDEIKKLKEQKETLKEMRADYHRDHFNLAVQKGICPFPYSCNRREYCTKNRCNHDECSNGYTFRRS